MCTDVNHMDCIMSRNYSIMSSITKTVLKMMVAMKREYDADDDDDDFFFNN